MTVNIFFSAEEIRSFFERNGFQVIESTFGRFAPAYHGKSEWTDYIADAVIIGSRQVEASKLFEKVSQTRLKRLITPHNEGMKSLIESEFKNLTK